MVVALQKQMPLTAVTSVIDGLKRLYVEKLKPLEAAYRFNDFASPLLVTTSSSQFRFTISLLIVLLCRYLHATVLVFIIFRQAAILIQSQWLCSWANILLEKQHSLSIC
jgi:hypothetical protein